MSLGEEDQEESSTLDPISPVHEFTVMKPETDNGESKIATEFMDSLNTPDTLDSLLAFLKNTTSPISTSLELRNLLIEQKEEKIALQSMLEKTRIEMQGIRYQLGIFS